MLQPLPVPDVPWQHVSMDFITDLPKTDKGHSSIFVVVDRFSKMVKLIPLEDNTTAPKIAEVFFDHVVRYHGIPASIVSDRDVRFTARFWKELFS